MGKKILVVDDEPDVVAYLTAVLRDNGYDTMEANDGEQTIRRIRHENRPLPERRARRLRNLGG